jgi:hypothetical protein
MGLDAKKSFAQTCEDVDVEDGVWGSSGVLESPNSKEARKEIRNRNRKSAFQKRSKSDDFIGIFIWMAMAQGRSPLNHKLRLKKSIIDERRELGFRALTGLESIIQGGPVLAASFSFPLVDLFGAMRRFTSRFTRMHLGDPPVFMGAMGSKARRDLGAKGG